jgi:hypothetical protein
MQGCSRTNCMYSMVRTEPIPLLTVYQEGPVVEKVSFLFPRKYNHHLTDLHSSGIYMHTVYIRRSTVKISR